jgi:hypothetical protein
MLPACTGGCGAAAAAGVLNSGAWSVGCLVPRLCSAATSGLAHPAGCCPRPRFWRTAASSSSGAAGAVVKVRSTSVSSSCSTWQAATLSSGEPASAAGRAAPASSAGLTGPSVLGLGSRWWGWQLLTCRFWAGSTAAAEAANKHGNGGQQGAYVCPVLHELHRQLLFCVAQLPAPRPVRGRYHCNRCIMARRHWHGLLALPC